MDELRELLSSGIQQKHSIMRFNCLPASYLHPLRREDFIPGLPDRVWETPRSWARLSRVILEHVNLSESFFEPNHWGWSIALLSPEKLKQIARYSGAIALLNKVRSSLAREHVLAWKKLLGEDAYLFAMTSASLLPITNFCTVSETDSQPETVGYSIISAVFQSMPTPMSTRCQLKIPPASYSTDIDSSKARRIVTTISELSGTRWFS